MSQNRKLTSLVSVVALFGLTGLLAAGCSNKSDGSSGGGSCAEIDGRVTALNASAADLKTAAVSIKADVIGACAKIAGMPVPATPTDADVTNICKAAKVVVDGAITGSVKVVLVPPVCTVDAQAQLDCEGSCTAKADVTCDPGSVDVRCDPGDLSVECSGKCQVNAKCEGSATVAVDCQGACEGSCSGTCSGTCNGTCDADCTVKNADGTCNGTCSGKCTGKCDASCMGTCKGNCTVTAMGGVQCSGGARCKGGCDVKGTAPQCEANLQPPSCDGSASAQCNADCQGSASLKANCTKPSVDIVGMVDATVKANLIANLPTLFAVTAKAKLAATAAGDLATNFKDVAGSVVGCTLDVGASVVTAFTGAVQATAEASASVNVSFTASASVSGSATAS